MGIRDFMRDESRIYESFFARDDLMKNLTGHQLRLEGAFSCRIVIGDSKQVLKERYVSFQEQTRGQPASSREAKMGSKGEMRSDITGCLNEESKDQVYTIGR